MAKAAESGRIAYRVATRVTAPLTVMATCGADAQHVARRQLANIADT